MMNMDNDPIEPWDTAGDLTADDYDVILRVVWHRAMTTDVEVTGREHAMHRVDLGTDAVSPAEEDAMRQALDNARAESRRLWELTFRLRRHNDLAHPASTE